MKKRKDNVFLDMPNPNLPSNFFDLSHNVTTSFNMGRLIPTTWIECLPGDSFVMSDENMFRMQPMVAPVMHEIRVTTHWWFVPYRLLWDDWEKHITGTTASPNGHPFVALDEVTLGCIGNYLGLPLGEFTEPESINPFPIAAYYLIYDNWYRDQNFIEEKFVPLVEGDNTTAYLPLLKALPLRRAWEHDAFTSALPEAQQGNPVQVPLVVGGSLPVEYVFRPGNENQNTGAFRDAGDGSITDAVAFVSNGVGPTPLAGGISVEGEYVAYDPLGTLVVDVQAQASDINDIRAAFAVQQLLEAMIRGGQRYNEMMQSIWGASPTDERLQRPEYVGGSKGRMVISQVLATAENVEAAVAVGDMAGHGISVTGGNTYTYRVQEYGLMMCFVNVQPVTAYQQGLHKAWSRLDRFDYAFPQLAGIGEQPVLNKEVKMTALQDDRNGTFGYMPQFNEYRFLNNRTTGDFQTTLSFWTLTRIFSGAGAPVLNESFIECDPDTRIFAVTSETVDKVLAQLFYNIRVDRRIPRFGIPTPIV